MATNYGFTQGVNSVTSVSVQSNLTCPANASSTVTAAGVKCYAVTITKTVPLYFVRAVGYRGTNGSGLQTISATAWAGPKDEPISVCVLALGPDQGNKSAILLNGAPRSNLGDCTIFSDDTATCHGGNSGAFIGGAVGSDSNCGIAAYSDAATVPDPDAAKASNIPANSCGKYQQEVPQNGRRAPAATLTDHPVPGGTYSAASLATAISNAANSSGGSGFAYASSESYTDPVTSVVTTKLCGRDMRRRKARRQCHGFQRQSRHGG